MLSVRSILTISALALAFAVSGCTRPEGDTSSKIKVVLPQTGNTGQNTEELMHVVINATGDGIANPILMIWDRHDDSSQTPSSFVLDIPMGSNRMVQVLAVYEDTSSQAMRFYYGDKVQTFSSSVESMTIPITSLGAATPIVSGRIAGRYLTSADAGPTGPVDVIYTPPGKPSLIIERSSIVNGWFHFFGLAGLPFGYRLADGTLLFGKNFDLYDSALAGSQKVLRVAVPASYREENHGGTSQWVQNEPNINIYGFFGPGADNSRYVCKPASFSALTRLAKADSPTGAVKLTYSASALPTTAALLSTTSPLASYYVEGGDAVSATCASPAAANAYIGYLKFDSNLIDGNGHDQSIGFEVPFAWNSSGRPLDIDNSDPRVITGVVLPGTESVIDSFKLFKRVTTESEFHLNQVDCFAIANGEKGFVPAGSGVLNSSTRAFSITSNISSAEVSAGVSAVVCPSKGGTLASQGLFIEKWSFSGGGGGGGGGSSGPPHHLVIRTRQATSPYACVEASVEVVDVNGYSTNATTEISFNVAGDSGQGAEILASGATCSTGAASANLTIPAGSSSAFFKFRGGSTSPLVDHINVTSVTGASLPATMTSQSEQVLIVPSGTITQIQVGSNSRSRINPGTCMPLTLKTLDAHHNPVSVGGTTPFTLAVESHGTTSLQLFTDPGCTSALAAGANNASFPSSTNQIVYYVKGLAEGSGAIKATMDQSIVISSVPTAYQAQMHFWMEVVSTGQATHLLVSTPYMGFDANSGNCLPLGIDVKNDALNPILITGNLQMNAFSTNGMISASFYTDASCVSPFPGGGIGLSLESTKTVYFRPVISSSSSNETISISASVSGSSGGSQFHLPGETSTGISPVKLVPMALISAVNQTLPVLVSYAGATCAEIKLELRNFSAVAVTNQTGAPMTLPLDFSPSPVMNGQIYSDASCTSSIAPPITLTVGPGSSTSNSYYVKADSGAYGQSYSFQYPSLPTGIQWFPTTLFQLDP